MADAKIVIEFKKEQNEYKQFKSILSAMKTARNSKLYETDKKLIKECEVLEKKLLSATKKIMHYGYVFAFHPDYQIKNVKDNVVISLIYRDPNEMALKSIISWVKKFIPVSIDRVESNDITDDEWDKYKESRRPHTSIWVNFELGSEEYSKFEDLIFAISDARYHGFKKITKDLKSKISKLPANAKKATNEIIKNDFMWLFPRETSTIYDHDNNLVCMELMIRDKKTSKDVKLFSNFLLEFGAHSVECIPIESSATEEDEY